MTEVPDNDKARLQAQERRARYEVAMTSGRDGQPKGLALPASPSARDVQGQCEWLTAVFRLDRAHPIKGGSWRGVAGPDGHVVLDRVEAREIRFEPAANIMQPTKLSAELTFRTLPSDGELYGYKTEHCRQIAHVIKMLCDSSAALTGKDQMAAILDSFLFAAKAIEGQTTYGDGRQKYVAACELERETEQFTGRHLRYRYLIDSQSGELVIAASDLRESARRYMGASLKSGWFEGRMDDLGWSRITVEGRGESDWNGDGGGHRRIYAYRGRLPTHDGESTYADFASIEETFNGASAGAGVAPDAEIINSQPDSGV